MSHVNHGLRNLSTPCRESCRRMNEVDRAEGEAEPETSVGKL